MIAEGIGGLLESGHKLCVVGSGPVGLALAADLVRRGERVLLLESGRAVADKEIQSLAFADLVDSSTHDDMRIATARRLGGTSHLWGARCLPFDPIDFEARDWVDATWPITYQDLVPFLGSATASLQAGDAVFEDVISSLSFADERFGCSQLERWANKQQAQDVHADAIKSSPLLDVRTCSTMVGMRFADGGPLTHIEVAHSLSGHRISLPIERVVLAAGGLESARLLLSEQRRAPQKFGGLNGPLGRYYMGHVSGEIADITFRDPAVAHAFDYHIDKHGSYVRRRLVPSESVQRENKLLNTSFWPVVPPVFDARHKSAILSMVYLAMRWPVIGTKIVAEAIRKQHAPVPAPSILPHVANLILGAPTAAIFGVDFMRRRYDKEHRLPGFFVHNPARRFGLSYHGEQVPRATSRVILGNGDDRLGLATLKIDYRFDEQDVASVVRTHDLLGQWLVETGLGRLEYRAPSHKLAGSVLAQACHGRHQIGITRMGTCRSSAIVNSQLACFDAPNLYIASCGVLPTSGQANPTLTAVALGLRLSEHLAFGP